MTPPKPDSRAVVLFSGGTDSTLAAALMAERFHEIHLVTYDRFGLFAVEGTGRVARGLQEKFGESRFRHTIINIDQLFKHISYESYFSDIRKHGFFPLSVCGLCKLSMHVRTIIYCHDNEIRHVCDGANKGMHLFPDQMKSVIEDLRGLYGRFGIDYTNPVFSYEPPEEGEFIEMQNRALIGPLPGDVEVEPPSPARSAETTGCHLYRLGLAPTENVKGTEYDRKRQPRCFQFILFNFFVLKYFLPAHSEKEYKDRTRAYFRDKIRRAERLVEGYMRTGSNEQLLKR